MGRLVVVFVAALAFALSACGAGGGTAVQPTATPTIAASPPSTATSTPDQADTRTCRSADDSYVVRYPTHWHTNAPDSTGSWPGWCGSSLPSTSPRH